MPEPEEQGGTTPPAGAPAAGTPAPPAGGTPAGEREKWIPRERFDEVNSKVESLQQQVAYLSQGAQPAREAQEQPAAAPQTDGIPQDFRSWEEWHATDPGAAIDWRSRQAYHQERQKTEFVNGRQKFLEEVYQEKPEWRDPVKRASDPTYLAFTKLLGENPASATSYAGLKQLHKLAKLESGALKVDAEAARQAGAITEQQRQAAAAAGFAPTGTGTSVYQPAGQAPQLSPEQQKLASKYGMNAQEYANRSTTAPQKIAMKYERAKRA